MATMTNTYTVVDVLLALALLLFLVVWGPQ